jgi:hypothetical protein
LLRAGPAELCSSPSADEATSDAAATVCGDGSLGFKVDPAAAFVLSAAALADALEALRVR